MKKTYVVTVSEKNDNSTETDAAQETCTNRAENNLAEIDKLRQVCQVIVNEYNIERSKKVSFENRATGMLAVLTAMVTFLFKKQLLIDWLMLFDKTLTFHLLLKMIGSLLAIVGCVATYYFSWKIVRVKILENANEEIFFDKEFMKQDEIKFLNKTNIMYHKLINEHRAINAINAHSLETTYKSMITFICGAVLYIVL